eukprot:2609639-Rhodomonas_salina.1
MQGPRLPWQALGQGVRDAMMMLPFMDAIPRIDAMWPTLDPNMLRVYPKMQKISPDMPMIYTEMLRIYPFLACG